MINAFGKEPGLPQERFWTAGKKVSGVIVVIYVMAALFLLGPADAAETIMVCALPLLMIWMPEVMGHYTGWGVIHGRPITRQSLPGLVWILGWVTLLLPAALLLFTMSLL